MHSAARVVVPVIALRAAVVWGVSRLLVAALPMAVGMSFGSLAPPPGAVVVLAGALGLIDVHVRGERILWANLGAGSGLLFVVYAAAAAAGEILLVLLSR